MSKKWLPHSFAVGLLCATLSVVGIGHSIVDRYVNDTLDSVRDWQLTAFAFMVFIGFRIIAYVASKISELDLHSKAFVGLNCQLEGYRVAIVLFVAAMAQIIIFDRKEHPYAILVAALLIFLYTYRLSRRMHASSDPQKWFKIF